MRRAILAMAASAAASIVLAGCAYGPGGYHDHGRFVAAEGDDDGFYDDFHGPVGDGY